MASLDRTARLERTLAAFLSRGTWISCAIMAAGMTLQALPHALLAGQHLAAAAAIIVKAGVALLILLPTARVAVMLAAFMRSHDRRYSVIAAIVLLVIAAGFVIGLHTAGVAG